MFVAGGRGHEHRDVLPDDLRGGVAEDPLGGRVERLDGPLLVDGDDAIHGGLDDRPDSVPALEQLLLHPLQRGDVGGPLRDGGLRPRRGRPSSCLRSFRRPLRSHRHLSSALEETRLPSIPEPGTGEDMGSVCRRPGWGEGVSDGTGGPWKRTQSGDRRAIEGMPASSGQSPQHEWGLPWHKVSNRPGHTNQRRVHIMG